MNRWLVASGGGSKGAPFHAGFLQARAEQGIEFYDRLGVIGRRVGSDQRGDPPHPEEAAVIALRGHKAGLENEPAVG